MQKVSNEYKASMKSSLRERSYMMISFGLVNQEAQANATVMGNNFAYYSKQTGLFGQRKEDTVYATLEHDFTKVDGSMYFLPRENTSGNYYDTGLISKPLIPSSGYELLIELNVVATDIKGLTINFGEVYPTRFDILTSSGQRIEIADNDQSEFSTEQVLENTTYIKFIFYKMKNPYSRLRIYSIQLGYGLVYYNDDIMDSKLDSYISPICEDVPQIDFMVKLQNYDQYFNVDNPNSAINFLETGQEMYVWYGYQLPNSDTIEWIRGAKLQCSAWESDDYSATIRCQDLFRNMDEEYYKGCYAPAGITYYHAAELVFQDAGIEEYYIDPYLKKSTTKNPIPRVKHKEALQIIANACRCVLSQNRYGRPQIKSSFAPEYDITCNGETEYSHVRNIKSETAKQEYASFAHNYTTVNAEMYYLPENQSKADKYTGYISLQQSNKDCLFEENPIIYITQETACMYYGCEKKSGYTDETYTAAVDNGSYGNFVRDSYGYGYAQWTYWSRKQNLLNFAKKKNKSIGDEEMQLEFLWEELTGSYKGVLTKLKAAKSTQEASNIILTGYEKPKDQGQKVKATRGSYAKEYYNQFAVKKEEKTMKVIIGSARRDENGKYAGGKPGDQDGVEVSTQNYYVHTKGWYMFRFLSDEHAKKVAKAMWDACMNNNIGYCQAHRSIMAMLKKYGSMKAIGEKTETDCSDLVRGCIYEARESF